MSENRIYTEDDLHDLLGEALEIYRAALRSEDANVRLDAASRILASPITMTFYRAQEAKNQFPRELKPKLEN